MKSLQVSECFSSEQLRWLECISKLKVDHSRGPAPHKPILLLVLCDLIEEELVENGIVKRNGALAFRFNSYWSIVAHRRRTKPEVLLPFFHIHSDGVWVPLNEDGSKTDNRQHAKLAQVDAALLLALQGGEFRSEFRRTIIANYFLNGEQPELLEMCGIDAPPQEIIDSDAGKYLASNDSPRKRDGKFSARVLPAYDFTCALTNYRMIAASGTCPLDAAHIRQFKKGGLCHPVNGLALSKNAHWLFDRGYWSIDDGYRIIVDSSWFEEDGEDALLLKPRAGEKMGLPRNEMFWPDRDNLKWHRAHHSFE